MTSNNVSISNYAIVKDFSSTSTFNSSLRSLAFTILVERTMHFDHVWKDNAGSVSLEVNFNKMLSRDKNRLPVTKRKKHFNPIQAKKKIQYNTIIMYLYIDYSKPFLYYKLYKIVGDQRALNRIHSKHAHTLVMGDSRIF